MNEFLIELQAKLDEAKSKGNINSDIKKLQNQIDKLKLQAEIDPKTISNLVKQLEGILNQKINISNIGINSSNAVKEAQQTGQQIGNAINQGVANAVNKTNNTLKSFSDLKSFSELNKSISNFQVDSKELKNYKSILDDVKNTYAEFGQVRITNEIFKDGILEKFKVNIEQVNGDLKETKSFIMALNEDKDAFVFSGLISGSESVVQHLDKTKNAINQTAEAINALREKAQIDKIQLSMDNGDYDTKILAYETSLKKLGLSSEEVSEKMKNVSKTYSELKASTTSDHIISDDVITKAKTLETEMSKLDNTVKQIRLTDSLQADDLQVEQTIIRLNNQLQKNGNYTKDSKNKIREWISELEKSETSVARLKEINVQAKELHSNMAAINRTGQGLFERISSKIGTLSTYLSAATIISRILSGVKNGISSIRELDTALVDLKKTTTMTAKELEDFYYASNETAKEMGVTTKEILDQASAWSRLGYSSAEAATKMAKYSSMFASISPGMNIDAATDGLVSMMKAYNIGNDNPDDVLDGIMSKINIIGNTAATSNAEIVNMLSKSSSAMAEANNTLEETIALETAAVEITRDDDSVGTAFKTISMRIRGYDEETEEFIGNIEELDGTIANLTKTASTPGGISLFTDDTKTTYKSTYQLLKEISDIYDQLSDKDQAELLEALAGKRQGQIVAATINNFEAVEKALENMYNSAGSAEREMSVIMDSMDYKLNTTAETAIGIFQNLFEKDDMKSVIDVLNSFLGILDSATEKLGLFNTAALGFGGIAGANNWG